MWIDFDADIDHPCYAFVILCPNRQLTVRASALRVTGVLSLTHAANKAVARSATQQPPEDIGVESFEFWLPRRRPGGHNLAMKIEPAIDLFMPQNVVNGIARPTNQPNAWVADPNDSRPHLTISWDHPQSISRIELTFDTDYDHPMESVLMGHPEDVMPMCVRKYRILDDTGQVLAACVENHRTRNTVRLQSAARTRFLAIQLEHPSDSVPAAVFEVRCYQS